MFGRCARRVLSTSAKHKNQIHKDLRTGETEQATMIMFGHCARRVLSTSAKHKNQIKNQRSSLINRTLNRKPGQLQSLLHDFSVANVPSMLESELSEFDNVLRLDDSQLNLLIERPGAPEERHPFLQSNFTLDRFLSFARFKTGTGEYR